VPRRLLLLNLVLGGVSLACAIFIVWELVAPTPARGVRSRPTAPAVPAPEPEPHQPASAYTVVAARNVFSPTRSEGPAPAPAGGAALGGPKPNLHGVVLRAQNPIAYIEDPLTKRVAGYRVGDPVAGGTLTTIAADGVVIARPEGPMDVRLRDPSKPRPPTPAAAPAGVPAPGQGAFGPGVVTPGIIMPGAPAQTPTVIPGGPGVQPQVQSLPPAIPGTMVGPFGPPGVGRPSLGLGRRLPIPPGSEAPATPQQ
jgi:hypothetical protein